MKELELANSFIGSYSFFVGFNFKNSYEKKEFNFKNCLMSKTTFKPRINFVNSKYYFKIKAVENEKRRRSKKANRKM